jgi:hypothetical protein
MIAAKQFKDKKIPEKVGICIELIKQAPLPLMV